MIEVEIAQVGSEETLSVAIAREVEAVRVILWAAPPWEHPGPIFCFLGLHWWAWLGLGYWHRRAVRDVKRVIAARAPADVAARVIVHSHLPPFINL